MGTSTRKLNENVYENFHKSMKAYVKYDFYEELYRVVKTSGQVKLNYQNF